ncbi:KEOPS complex subunit Cgi121 [Halopenitus salinus]|uniref:KEOPS complex subunit Cgi121 n=1 Tax=Halopenitus salinus TaxID=1198295 RepID=A0ABD5USR2_9EURY
MTGSNEKGSTEEGSTEGEACDACPNPRFLVGTTSIDDLDAFLGRVRSIRRETGAVVQVVDARYVVSTTQLERAVARAERAFERGEEVARDHAVETLLYAAGRRQIDDALEMGVDEGETPAIGIAYASSEERNEGSSAADGVDVEVALDRLADLFADGAALDPDDSAAPTGSRERVAERTDEDRVRAFYDVSDRELAATDGTLADVIEERVALLDVEK